MSLRSLVLCAMCSLILTAAGLMDRAERSHPGHRLSSRLIHDREPEHTGHQRMLYRTQDRSIPQPRGKPHDDRIDGSSENTQQVHGHRRHRKQSYGNNDRGNPSISWMTGERDSHPSLHHRQDARRVPASRPDDGRVARRLPQAIIIGVKKGGTRALLEILRMHPEVRAPGPEPHFFDRNYDKGLHWYRRQMPSAHADQVTMEKTPSYFVTKGVPGRIFNMSRHVKFIIVVRDPVTRAISDYTQALTKRDNISSFESMAFDDNSTGLVDTSWGAIRIGVYAKHLDRWLQYFPLSQMHFVSGERLITDPAGEIGKVQDFLGLDRVITDNNFLFNTTKGFPCLVRPGRVRKLPHCLSKSKGREHPLIQHKALQRLREFFRPFNQKFYQMVGRDFGWS